MRSSEAPFRDAPEVRPRSAPSDAEEARPDRARDGPAHHLEAKPKSFEVILAEEIWQGLSEMKRPAKGLLLSGLSAGLDIGFSLFFMAVALTLLGIGTGEPLTTLVVANMYSVGFIFVVLGRSELFTEHTALAVFPVLGGKASLGQLGRLWILIYAANLVGAAIFAAFSVALGPRLGVVDPAAFGAIAHELLRHDMVTMLLSAVMAGWLMGLLSWLVTAAQGSLSRIFIVWIITFGMGLAGLHHCIVGTVEVLSGVLSGTAGTLADYGRFLLWTTLGNAVGGVTLVAILKYSHAVQTSAVDE